MKKVICFLFAMALLGNVKSQCVGVQSFTVTPAAPGGGYTAGTIVTVCYTMNGWPGINIGATWVEGFDINLGPGWGPPTPLAPPINCQGGGGNWLWLNTSTSTVTGITVGPGWFFNSQTGCFPCNNALAGEDFGDSGSCTWTFCFNVTVAQGCLPQNLLIQVTAGGDGDWGSWANPVCPTTPFTIYNGASASQAFTIGPVLHN